MRKGFVFVVLAAAWLWSSVAWAQSGEKILVLRTGEVVRGVAVKEGPVYKVTSEVLGPLTIQEIDVTTIHDATAASDEWQERKNQLMSDPAAIASMRGMTQDKEIMDFVMDPEIQKAVKEQDIEALRNNPKFVQFASRPEVQKLAQEMAAKEKQ